MEFRLIYRGKLLAASAGDSRAAEKHRIRRYLNPQLRTLWQVQEPLATWLNLKVAGVPPGRFTIAEAMTQKYVSSGHRFLPLITKELCLSCSLDVLFLRRDEPGDLIKSGGDIDNRVKCLFDALRMPKSESEVHGFRPEEGEDPLFVLLEDDSLINSVSVTTDRLLMPPADDEYINDVHLVIGVRLKVLRFTGFGSGNGGFLG